MSRIFITCEEKPPDWILFHKNDQHDYHHDDVIKWKYFPRYWPFVRGIHRSPVNSPHKGQWRGALMFFLSYLRRIRAHYTVTVMRHVEKDPMGITDTIKTTLVFTKRDHPHGYWGKAWIRNVIHIEPWGVITCSNFNGCIANLPLTFEPHFIITFYWNERMQILIHALK